MRSQLLIAATVASLGIVLSVGEARADITYSDGGTYTVSSPLPVENVVLSNGTTLNLAAGGSVSGADADAPAINAYALSASYSTVNLNGGSVTGGNASNYAFGINATNSTVNVNSGTITGGTAPFSYGIGGSSSTVNVYGGNVEGGSTNGFGPAISCGLSTVNVYGGNISGYPGSDSIDGTTVNVNVGTLVGRVFGTNGVNVYGGTVTSNNSFGSAILASGPGATGAIQGGVITGYVEAANTCVMNISGGSITGYGPNWNYGVECGSNGVINISGGKISVNGGGSWNAAVIDKGGTVNITGGDITYSGPLKADWSAGIYAQSGTINIYGSNFDYAYGAIADTSGTLSGTLSDGSAFDMTFYQDTPGEIVLHTAPEPATMSLLVLGGLAMLRHRKREVEQIYSLNETGGS